MSQIIRFGVSLEKSLSEKFDAFIRNKRYTNRSEAIRDIIRRNLIEKEWHLKDKIVAAIITFIYDHHQRELINKIIHIQHDYHNFVVANQHIHLDRHNCLEVIISKGKPKEIKNLFDRLNSLKGVRGANLIPTTTGKEIH